MKQLALVLLLTGCGVNDNDHVNTPMEPPVTFEDLSHKDGTYGDFTKYVVEFKYLVELATGIRPTDHLESIKYAETSQEKVWALCHTWTYNNAPNVIVKAKIELDPNMADKSKILERVVILHELGHCIMGSDHVNDPSDLMNPTVPADITENEANAHIKHYMQRLTDGVEVY